MMRFEWFLPEKRKGSVCCWPFHFLVQFMPSIFISFYFLSFYLGSHISFLYLSLISIPAIKHKV